MNPNGIEDVAKGMSCALIPARGLAEQNCLGETLNAPRKNAPTVQTVGSAEGHVVVIKSSEGGAAWERYKYQNRASKKPQNLI